MSKPKHWMFVVGSTLTSISILLRLLKRFYIAPSNEVVLFSIFIAELVFLSCAIVAWLLAIKYWVNQSSEQREIEGK
jgi:hypothetical protein